MEHGLKGCRFSRTEESVKKRGFSR